LKKAYSIAPASPTALKWCRADLPYRATAFVFRAEGANNLLCVLACVALVLCASACGKDGDPNGPPNAGVNLPPDGKPVWDTLSQWQLFTDFATQTPTDGMFPYDVRSPLFSDETVKHRFMWIPDGSSIEYDAHHAWRFPVGTVLVKTFGYPVDARDPTLGEQLIETRLLVHRQDGWEPHTYVYNEDASNAQRKVAGVRSEFQWIDATGADRSNRYAVPNTNQCLECHGENERTDTIGGTTRQLNRLAPNGEGNQIDLLIARGWLDGAEPATSREALVDPLGSDPIAERMRSYVDANCGHCHNNEWAGDSGSGLWLRYDLTDPAVATPGTLGLCKMPQSAGGATCGRVLDVVPGEPDSSILICRLESEVPKVQMPPLGRNLHDAAGVTLMRDWISSLSGACL
jgi:uncharacterized repeat protein (TIGR03806 family)